MSPTITMSPVGKKLVCPRGPIVPLSLYKPHMTVVPMVYHSPEKGILRQRILAILDDINNDIIKMYEELKPLETNIDIDMTCYLDPETNEVVCVGA